jgi:hypothetical protein
VNLTKWKLYLELAVICGVVVCTFYVIPLGIFIGELTPQLVFMTAVNWVMMWKFNATFHMLLDKWRGGK